MLTIHQLEPMILNGQPSQIEKERGKHLITDQFSLMRRKLRHDEMLLFWRESAPVPG